MAISRITSQDAVSHINTSGSSVTATYPGATTAGNLLIAFVIAASTTTDPSISGWTLAVTGGFDNQAHGGALFYKLATGSETTVTAVNSGGLLGQSISIFEYTGNANPIIVDGTPATQNTGGSGVTTEATPTITTANANDLIFVALGAGTAPTGVSWATSTLIGSNSGGNWTVFCGEHIVAAPQTSFSDTATWTGGAPAQTVIAAFQAAGSGTPAPVNFVKAPTVMVMR